MGFWKTMATHNWGTNRPLENFLLSEAHLFDFYQAVRLLESCVRKALQLGKPAILPWKRPVSNRR